MKTADERKKLFGGLVQKRPFEVPDPLTPSDEVVAVEVEEEDLPDMDLPDVDDGDDDDTEQLPDDDGEPDVVKVPKIKGDDADEDGRELDLEDLDDGDAEGLILVLRTFISDILSPAIEFSAVNSYKNFVKLNKKSAALIELYKAKMRRGGLTSDEQKNYVVLEALEDSLKQSFRQYSEEIAPLTDEEKQSIEEVLVEILRQKGVTKADPTWAAIIKLGGILTKRGFPVIIDSQVYGSD